MDRCIDSEKPFLLLVKAFRQTTALALMSDVTVTRNFLKILETICLKSCHFKSIYDIIQMEQKGVVNHESTFRVNCYVDT